MSSLENDDAIESAPEGDDRPEESTAPDTEEPAPKRAAVLRLKAAVILPLLVAVASGVYFFTIDGIIAGQLVAQGTRYAGEGGEARVGEVSFSIFGPKLTVRDYDVWQNLPDREVHEVAHVEEAVFDVDFWPLLERRLVVNEMSATRVRLAEPIREEEDEPEAEVPTDTSNPGLNDYLEDAKDILESEELRDVQDWLEKLREYMDRDDEPEAETPTESVREIGPAARAWYVEEALKNADATARVVVRKAAVNEVAFTFGEPDEAAYAYKVTDLVLSAEEVSSDPIANGRPMKFIAEGNLDGVEDKRVEIGLTVRFDPDELVTLEQVDGRAAFASLPIADLVDPGVFGDTLGEASLTITHFAPAHRGMAGRTRIQLGGLVQPPGFERPSRASFALWFGGFERGTAAGFAPSGISVNVVDFPLGPVLDMAGGSPIPLRHENATITFGTCNLDGTMEGPGAALTWHDGLNVNLRLKVNGMEFADPQGELAGLPGTFMVRGLNRVIEDMGGLDVIVGFAGSRDDIALDLKKPGLRAFADAVVNALTLTAPEIKSMVDLPFEVSSNATFDLASVNADGTRRDPALSVEGEARHDLDDLRVAINVRDLAASPKPGQGTVLGLPAADFCNAFNTFMGGLGDEGLTLRSRVMNAEGQFSPALESPGTRGLVDAMAGALRYSGQQLNRNFDLPVNVTPGAEFDFASVDEQGSVRGLDSPGADADDLSGLRIRVRAGEFSVSPKPGQSTVLGVPAGQFTTAFNTFLEAQGEEGLALDWRVFGGGGEFAPALESPGTRGLLDGVVNTLRYSGDELNTNFDLPFKLDDKAAMSAGSVDAEGNLRRLDGPDSDSGDLAGMTVAVLLKDGYAAPKQGQERILGVPADHFTFAWNKLQGGYAEDGFPMRIALYNDKGEFAPALRKPDEEELLKLMGDAVGINNFEDNFAKLSDRFAEEFPAFREGGLKVAEDIAKGKIKLPGTGEGDTPELPDIPDIPDVPDRPKFPWEE